MALLLPLRLARVALGAGRARGRLAAGGGSCGGRELPPCAPCPAAPPPACRARSPSSRTAQRIVCCAPPQGQRPPCAPRAPSRPFTCRDALDQNRESSYPANHNGECDQDSVALRLKLAKCAQQAEYELEVQERARRVAPRPPCATYRLRGERECARATDGCTYAVLSPGKPTTPRCGPGRSPPSSTRCGPGRSPPPSTRCGPGRSPPPPRCVELAPDDACRIRGDAHLDPCAHRPRIMIDIDRSGNAAAPGPATPVPVAPRVPSTKCGGAPAPSWCASPPSPVSAPPRCRRPTIVERLRARPPESPSERRIHTSTTFSKAEKCAKSTAGGLENMLRSKQQLKQAGLGRVVVSSEVGRSEQKAPEGRLELSVPAGTRRVAVLVSLEGAAGGPCHAVPAPQLSAKSSSSAAVCGHKPSICTKTSTTSVRQDSWLSIKQIQKKLSNRCGEVSTDVKAVSYGSGRGHRTVPPAELHKATLTTRRCSSTSSPLANSVLVGSV